MTRFRRPAVCPCAFVIAALGAIAMLADSILTLDHPAFRFGLVAFIVGTTAAIVVRTTATNAAIEAARQPGTTPASGKAARSPDLSSCRSARTMFTSTSATPQLLRQVSLVSGWQKLPDPLADTRGHRRAPLPLGEHARAYAQRFRERFQGDPVRPTTLGQLGARLRIGEDSPPAVGVPSELLGHEGDHLIAGRPRPPILDDRQRRVIPLDVPGERGALRVARLAPRGPDLVGQPLPGDRARFVK
jgi:hypothetical protein